MLRFSFAQDAKGDVPEDNIEMQNGFLSVRVVFSVDNSPISRATVTIYSEDKGRPVTNMVLETGIDGYTETVPLPAPAIKYSLTATSIIVPFSSYTIRVEYAGFYTNVYQNAQVFADTTTIQESRMYPLPYGVRNAPGMERVFTLPMPQPKGTPGGRPAQKE